VNCPNCGASNLETSSICVNCGRQLAAPSGSYVPPPPSYNAPQSYSPPPPPASAYGAQPGATGPAVPNYLIQSILVTLCCCMPLGIVAIIFSAQVNTKLTAGDFAGAQEASKKAKLFCLIAVGLGLAAMVIGFLINGAAILSSMGR
jgi:hypothetical protein